MRKKGIIFTIVSITVGLLFMIMIPITIISYDLSSYGKIEEDKPYTHAPNSPASIQNLNLNIDVGDVEIKYIFPPTNYVMKIHIQLDMVGVNLSGKSFTDIFSIFWQNSSSSLNLSLFLKTNSWFDRSLVLLRSLVVIVYLNADYLFNINCNITFEGNFEIQVPWDVSINNVYVKVNNGNILFDFIYCIFNGNITGVVDSGDIELIANNAKYTHNNRWDLINDEGIIKFNIIQYRAMEANLTGIGKTNMGEIKIQYRDISPIIGAMFIFHNYSRGWGGIYNIWEGFPENPESFYNPPDVGYIFTSFDFPTIDNYNISLYQLLNSGEYTANLSSIPFNP